VKRRKLTGADRALIEARFDVIHHNMRNLTRSVVHYTNELSDTLTTQITADVTASLTEEIGKRLRSVLDGGLSTEISTHFEHFRKETTNNIKKELAIFETHISEKFQLDPDWEVEEKNRELEKQKAAEKTQKDKEEEKKRIERLERSESKKKKKKERQQIQQQLEAREKEKLRLENEAKELKEQEAALAEDEESEESWSSEDLFTARVEEGTAANPVSYRLIKRLYPAADIIGLSPIDPAPTKLDLTTHFKIEGREGIFEFPKKE